MSLLEEYYKFNKSLIEKYGNNSVVLMMVGSFYEVYCEKFRYEYAKNITDVLGIQLTRKNKSQEVSNSNPYTCGFPCYAISKHLSKLLHANFTVAIYDQFDIEGAKEKYRKLINIYSPSTYIEEEIITNNWLCLIRIDTFLCPIEKRKMLSGYVTMIDLSTGKNYVFECYDNKDNYNMVEIEIKRILYSMNPCEILLLCDNDKIKNNICKEFEDKMIHIQQFDKKYSNSNYQISFLEKIFGKSQIGGTIESIGLHRNGELLSSYIHLLQFAYEHDNNIVNKIDLPKMMNSKNELHINNDCLFQLNLISNNQTDNSHKITSLFDVINMTCTKMGKRLLKNKILRPITDKNMLKKSYNQIEKIMTDVDVYRHLLKDVTDIEKKYRKMVLGKLNPYEFSALDTSFQNIISIFNIPNDTFETDKKYVNQFNKFYDDYINTFNLDILGRYDLTNIKLSFFKEGINLKIDKLNTKIKDIYKQFNIISDKLKLFGNNKANVKLASNEKDGFYFTTTNRCWNEIFQMKDKNFKLEYIGAKKPLLFKVEDIIISKNKNTVKMTSKLINRLSNILLQNVESIKRIARKEYLKKLKFYQDKWNDCFVYVIKQISDIDLITNYAFVSKKYGYCKPIIKDYKKSYVDIKNIRHPIIERIQDDTEYITNDVSIGKNKNGMLLYGLNSSGKSSLLRAVGCNIILAQMGMYTSASHFEYYPYKSLLTKISNNDNLFKGQSTFIVEMQELKNILKKCNSHSMILCDELTAGTETYSATGIVASTVCQLVKRDSNFLFTTHLHELMMFEEIKNNSDIEIFHFDISVNKDSVVYKRKLEPGSGKSKYGIEIAKALDLDSEFIKMAFDFRNRYEGYNSELLNSKKSRYNSKVFVDICNRCGSRENLHTHHINEQKLSNKNGLIKHFPKNIKHNLEILCESCHIKHHK